MSNNFLVEGYINKKIWSVRNKTKNLYLKDFIDYYLVGGMTQEEQLKYLPAVGKNPLSLSRGNMAIDFLSTAAISVGGPVLDFALGTISEYEATVGLYAGLSATSWSAVINGSRLIYSVITRKPVESFSPVSLFANSTTYINKLVSEITNTVKCSKKINTLEFIIDANHSEMLDQDIKGSIVAEYGLEREIYVSKEMNGLEEIEEETLI